MHPPLSRPALVDLLAQGRREENLSIRAAAAMASVPPSTAQGWFEGRHLPTPALMPNFMTLCSALNLVEGKEDMAAWQETISRLRTSNVTGESPYVGLRSYTARESGLYVGRERAYTLLVEACTSNPRPSGALTVVVVGDSGSGKSSLLAAGLIGRACSPEGPLNHLEPVSLDVAALPDSKHLKPQRCW